MSERLRSKLSRREFLTGAALTAGALLAACAPQPTAAPAPTAVPEQPAEEPTEKPPEEPVEEPTEAPPAVEPVELVWYTTFGTWGEPGLQPAVDAYVEMNENVTFAPLIWAFDSTEGTLEGLLSRVAAGTPPDIALMWDSPVSLGVRGAASELDDLMVLSNYSALEEWPERLFRSCRFAGKTYGFPSFNAVYCIWYIQELLEERGIPATREEFPKTWDEMRELSKQFTEYDGETPTRVGYFPLWNFFADMWLQFNGGGSYDWDNMEYYLNRDENIEALEYGVNWIDEEYQGNYDNVKNTGWDFWDDLGGEPAFQDGRMVILHGGNFSMGMYWGENPPQYGWEIAGFPMGPSGPTEQLATYYGNWLLIPSGTENMEAAFEFVDWFNGEGVKYWVESGNPDTPGSAKFMELNPDFLPPLVVEHRGEEYARDWMQFFDNQQKNAVDMFGSPIASFQWDQTVRAAERTLKKAATASEALQEAHEACVAELDRLLSSM